MDRKAWLKPYIDSLEQQYRLTPEAQSEVDAYFNRLEGMANRCKDQAEFTTLFLQDPMYQEYTGFFTKYQKMALAASGETVEEAKETLQRENAEISAREHVKDMAEIEMNAAISHMLPDEVNRLRRGGARTLPIIGPIIQWVDNIKWVRRMFGKGE